MQDQTTGKIITFNLQVIKIMNKSPLDTRNPLKKVKKKNNPLFNNINPLNTKNPLEESYNKKKEKHNFLISTSNIIYTILTIAICIWASKIWVLPTNVQELFPKKLRNYNDREWKVHHLNFVQVNENAWELIFNDNNKLLNNFVKKIYDEAKTVADNLNIPVVVILAQAILESNYGRSDKAIQANNLIWRKGNKENGMLFPTQEEIDGKLITVNHYFKVYNTVQESIQDRGTIISNPNGPYRKHIEKLSFWDRKNPEKVLEAIHKGGYATLNQKDYISRVMRVVNNINKSVEQLSPNQRKLLKNFERRCTKWINPNEEITTKNCWDFVHSWRKVSGLNRYNDKYIEVNNYGESCSKTFKTDAQKNLTYFDKIMPGDHVILYNGNQYDGHHSIVIKRIIDRKKWLVEAYNFGGNPAKVAIKTFDLHRFNSKNLYSNKNRFIVSIFRASDWDDEINSEYLSQNTDHWQQNRTTTQNFIWRQYQKEILLSLQNKEQPNNYTEKNRTTMNHRTNKQTNTAIKSWNQKIVI